MAGLMDKTLEIHLADQRNAIYEAIINSETPEATSWVSKMVWSEARIHFAKLVLDVLGE
jgi:hypothetical protein